MWVYGTHCWVHGTHCDPTAGLQQEFVGQIEGEGGFKFVCKCSGEDSVGIDLDTVKVVCP